MKLRNKKTGEVVDVESLGHAASLKEEDGYQVTLSWKTEYENLSQCKDYQSLAELNEEWEDYKPKEFWLIVQDGDIFSEDDTITQDYADRLQAIGNHFEAKEEAKKAVEKLKAWKRLKDKGFRFDGWDWKAQSIDYRLDYSAITEEQSEEADKDIALIFGGEE